MAITKAQLLGLPAPKPTPVAHPALGDQRAYLLPLSGSGLDRYDQIRADLLFPAAGEADWVGLRAALLGLTLCDEQGELLGFTAAELGELGKKSGALIEHLYRTAKTISGLDSDAVEQAEKNSPGGPTSSSGSN